MSNYNSTLQLYNKSLKQLLDSVNNLPDSEAPEVFSELVEQKDIISEIEASLRKAINATPITTADEFAAMDSNLSYYLANDITITTTYSESFSGKFNGNGCTITTTVPLFSSLSGASISDLIIKGTVSASSTSSLGALAKTCTGSTIFNVTNNASISGASNVGGLVGSIDSSATFANCLNNASVTGAGDYIGGLFGYASATGDIILENCTSIGEVSGGSNIGGFGGGIAAAKTVTITNCERVSSDTNIVSTGNAGGIIGYVYNCNAVSVSGCKVANASCSGTIVGGILGNVHGNNLMTEIAVTDCVSLLSISGSSHCGGIIGLVSYPGADCKLNILKCVYAGGSLTSTGKVGGILGNTGNNDNSYLEFTFDSCVVKTAISSGGYCGGIVGDARDISDSDGALVIQNCLVYGSITTTNSTSAHYVGGLYGYRAAGKNSINKICNNAVYADITNTNASLVNAIGGYSNTPNTNGYIKNNIYVGSLTPSSTGETVLTQQGSSYLITRDIVTNNYYYRTDNKEFDYMGYARSTPTYHLINCTNSTPLAEDQEHAIASKDTNVAYDLGRSDWTYVSELSIFGQSATFTGNIPILAKKVITAALINVNKQTVTENNLRLEEANVSIKNLINNAVIPSGEFTITSNGTYDISGYASVVVDVASAEDKPSIVTFTVNGTSYTVDSGTDWETFVMDNTDSGFSFSGTKVTYNENIVYTASGAAVEMTDIITAQDYTIGESSGGDSGTETTVTFTINDTEYTVDEGTTWQNWYDSEDAPEALGINTIDEWMTFNDNVLFDEEGLEISPDSEITAQAYREEGYDEPITVTTVIDGSALTFELSELVDGVAYWEYVQDSRIYRDEVGAVFYNDSDLYYNGERVRENEVIHSSGYTTTEPDITEYNYYDITINNNDIQVRASTADVEQGGAIWEFVDTSYTEGLSLGDEDYFYYEELPLYKDGEQVGFSTSISGDYTTSSGDEITFYVNDDEYFATAGDLWMDWINNESPSGFSLGSEDDYVYYNGDIIYSDTALTSQIYYDSDITDGGYYYTEAQGGESEDTKTLTVYFKNYADTSVSSMPNLVLSGTYEIDTGEADSFIDSSKLTINMPSAAENVTIFLDTEGLSENWSTYKATNCFGDASSANELTVGVDMEVTSASIYFVNE